MVKYDSPGTRAVVLRQGTLAEHGRKMVDVPMADRWFWDTEKELLCYAIEDFGDRMLVDHYDHSPNMFTPHLLPAAQTSVLTSKTNLINIKKALEFQL